MIAYNKIFDSKREDLFEKYSGLIFDIASKLSQNQKNAEEIALSSFRQLLRYQTPEIFFRPFSIVRIVLQTAHDHFGLQSSLKRIHQNGKKVIDKDDLKIDKLFFTSAICFSTTL